MRIGTQLHKELLCEAFIAAHRPYEPSTLDWPTLDDDTLALLRGLPFWTHALQAEEDAGPMIAAVAARERDPLVRRALELQSYEESRHARILRHMFALYELPYEEPAVAVPADAVTAFADFGFEECLDSFGAFGLFKLAREHTLVPDGLFAIFDRVMQEEAHHITFFVNWFAYSQAQGGIVGRALRRPRSLRHYGRALWKLVDLVRDDSGPEGRDFVVTGAASFVDGLTPARVITACLEENERRLAHVDRRLLVPTLVPSVARLGDAVLRIARPLRREEAAKEPTPRSPEAAVDHDERLAG